MNIPAGIVTMPGGGSTTTEALALTTAALADGAAPSVAWDAAEEEASGAEVVI